MKFLLALFLLLSIASSFAIETYTIRVGESKLDRRYDYDNKLIKLALEKTIKEYGPYKIKHSFSMNFARAKQQALRNSMQNFIFKMSYEDKYEQMKLVPIKFPVDLGIVGYRVCFISPKAKKIINKKLDLNELLKLKHGQGLGWSDNQILRNNGFQVLEVSNYESLFRLVSRGRIDLFCRGVNELRAEFLARVKTIKNLDFDHKFILHYDLPRFFYTHESNKRARERISKGLKLAYNDGSLQKLWKEQYLENLKFVDIKKRKIIKINNSLVKKIDFNYKKYYVKP